MNRGSLAVALLLLTGCGEGPMPEQSAAPAPITRKPPYLLTVLPMATVEKTPFSVQPDGSSALAVRGKGFDRNAVIMANRQQLKTSFGNSGWLTSKMPAELYEKPGVLSIKVVNPDGKESKPIEFKVVAKDR